MRRFQLHLASGALTTADLLNPVPLNYEPVKPNSGATMTEEEERELAELMSDED